MKEHFTGLWNYGHIKLWSIDTLRDWLSEIGFSDTHLKRAGRVPALVKSMRKIATKPHARFMFGLVE
jgi:2-polyprenyl-6-hydroxyphenyl methylase/3-demethylubiquinone-9 3-methyltransferase